MAMRSQRRIGFLLLIIGVIVVLLTQFPGIIEQVIIKSQAAKHEPSHKHSNEGERPIHIDDPPKPQKQHDIPHSVEDTDGDGDLAPAQTEQKPADEPDEPIGPEPQDLDERVLSKKTAQGFLVVAIVNSGHLEFLQNFQIAMRRIGLHRQFLVVALDKSLETSSQKLGITTIPGTHFTDLPGYDAESWKKEMLWSHGDYNQLVNTKIVIIHAMLKKYQLPIVFTDVDLVWLQPRMLDYLKYMFDIGSFDFIMARDIWGVLYNACTGFYAVRPTEWAIQWMENVMTSDIKNGNNDQVVFNILMSGLPRQDLLRVHMLPLELFVNGEAFDNGVFQMYNVKPWLFHANYRVGKVEKRKLLEKAGFWFVK